MTRGKTSGWTILAVITVLLSALAGWGIDRLVQPRAHVQVHHTTLYYAGNALSNYIDGQFKQANSSVRISKVEKCIGNPRDRTHSQYVCLVKVNNGVCGLVQFTFTNDSDHALVRVQRTTQVDPRNCK